MPSGRTATSRSRSWKVQRAIATLPDCLQRLAQQAVGVVAVVARAEVVGLVVERRVDLLAVDEVLDVDQLRALARGGRDLVLGELDEGAVGELVAHHDLVLGDLLVLLRADAAVLDPRAVLQVDLVEVDALGLGRREDLHRDGDQPEDDRAVPDRAWGHVRMATHSFQEERDLLDGRAVGDALLLARVAEVQEADRQLVGGDVQRGAAVRRSPSPGPSASSRRGRARGRRAARCRRPRRSRARPRGPAPRRRSAWPTTAISVGARSSFEPLPGLASSATRLSAARASGPRTRKRHGSVRWWFGAQRASSKSSSSTSSGTGSGPNALCVRRVRIRSSSGRVHPGDATSRRTAASAFGSPWSWTSWPAPLTIISLPPGAWVRACFAHSYGRREVAVAVEQQGRDVREVPRPGRLGDRHRRPVQALPGEAVLASRSRGRTGSVSASVSLSAAASSASSRPSSGADASPQGAGQSAHSVLACRPWLSCAAV